ncbi:MAG: hypothetical protein R3A44_31545 [Caldilineaceae bacterium]
MHNRQNIIAQNIHLHREQDIDSELAILEVMGNELESYIVDNNVYRTVFVSTDSGRYRFIMSGGDLLVRLQTLQAMRESLALDQKDRLNTIITQVETTTSSLHTPYQRLLQRELKSRLATLEWAREEAEAEDVEQLAPADAANYLHIAVLRNKLDEETPHSMDKELRQLEDKLQKALAQLSVGQQYKV